jgi:hypothetical protein
VVSRAGKFSFLLSSVRDPVRCRPVGAAGRHFRKTCGLLVLGGGGVKVVFSFAGILDSLPCIPSHSKGKDTLV